MAPRHRSGERPDDMSEETDVPNAANADKTEFDEDAANAEEEQRRAEEEAKAKEERDARRKELVEKIAASDEGFIEFSDDDAEAIGEAEADGFIYRSNVQRGIEVQERFFLTEEGWKTRGS